MSIFGVFKRLPLYRMQKNIPNRFDKRFMQKLMLQYYLDIYMMSTETPKPLRSTKPKSTERAMQYFIDVKQLRAIGGKGGDGNVSFLQLWANDRAGPDGGNGGNGAHVLFKVSKDVKDFRSIPSIIKAQDGEKGYNDNCYGKNAENFIVKVPIGTVIRNAHGKIVVDLDKEGLAFVAARGGAGGHGNTFFVSATRQTPKICEYGAYGEDKQYTLEIRSMAHFGLIGLPNAGKSTLLRAISRARPKVAAYPFTTLKPHIGMVLYDDYEQVAVADLPGLIEESHKNKGLGIVFLKHAERCRVLLYILDLSQDEPWHDLKILRHEIKQFSKQLEKRRFIIVANKVDLPNSLKNLEILMEKTNLPIIPVSAKKGTNISMLLRKMRESYDEDQKKRDSEI
ncbi:mitochondrial ribosome-associated GTPase 2 isoform X2 [Prorops nasuta]